MCITNLPVWHEGRKTNGPNSLCPKIIGDQLDLHVSLLCWSHSGFLAASSCQDLLFCDSLQLCQRPDAPVNSSGKFWNCAVSF